MVNLSGRLKKYWMSRKSGINSSTWSSGLTMTQVGSPWETSRIVKILFRTFTDDTHRNHDHSTLSSRRNSSLGGDLLSQIAIRLYQDYCITAYEYCTIVYDYGQELLTANHATTSHSLTRSCIMQSYDYESIILAIIRNQATTGYYSRIRLGFMQSYVSRIASLSHRLSRVVMSKDHCYGLGKGPNHV
jgi:hypothetical protein